MVGILIDLGGSCENNNQVKEAEAYFLHSFNFSSQSRNAPPTSRPLLPLTL